MALTLTLYKNESGLNNKSLLVFIHGLGAPNTWSSDEANWVKYITSDRELSDVDTAIVKYDTAHFTIGCLSIPTSVRFCGKTFSFSKLNDIDVLTQELRRELLDIKLKQYEKVVLVGHSMGGLIASWYVLQMIKNDIPFNVVGCLTIATPFNGSGAAGLIRFYSGHAQIPQLASNSTFLDDLIRLWQDCKQSNRLHQVVFRFAYAMDDFFVSKESALPHVESNKWIATPLDGGHSDVIRLKNGQETSVYRYLKSSLLFIIHNHKACQAVAKLNSLGMDDEWFERKLNTSIKNLGKRYSPELNYELDIAKVFDGLLRNQDFKSHFDARYSNLLVKYKKFIGEFRSDESSLILSIKADMDNMADLYSSMLIRSVEPILVKEYLAILVRLFQSLSEFEDYFCRLEEDGKPKSIYNERYNHGLNVQREFTSCLVEFERFLRSNEVFLANMPALILNGDAGVGKSHLLADVALKNTEAGNTSILLLGQHFTNIDPWEQILQQLGIHGLSSEELLTLINEKSKLNRQRSLFIIDAINEGQGRILWPQYIRGFISSFQNYEWIGLVLSVRSSYEKLLIPDDIQSVVKIEHNGFEDQQYDASKAFFDYYGIQQPGIPLLHPEFTRPLFLKLFCEGLSKLGLTVIPDGYEGITTIVGFYLDSVNKKMSQPERFNYPEGLNPIKRICNLFVQKLLEKHSRWLSLEDAHILIEEESGRLHIPRGLLQELISEGILTKNLIWHDDKYEDVVFLAYERFEDHLMASFLIERYIDASCPEIAFSQENPLHEYVKDERVCAKNKGLIEALSIQLPEKVGKELYDVAPSCKAFYPVIESFVQSLVWRQTGTFHEGILDYIRNYVLRENGTYQLFLETILLVTSNPNHYFNADFLHYRLIKETMPVRDSWWSIYIFKQYSEDMPAKRIVDWAWHQRDNSHISDESIRLTAVTLTWFLTTTNRHLRDGATKALIALLENRLEILIKLVKQFETVDDLYISERLFAVAYGCALRTEQIPVLKELSEYIYFRIFDNGDVIPHILLRDYARGVIEISHIVGAQPNVKLEKIRPPFRSAWPRKIPNDDEIKAYEKDGWGSSFIVSSLKGHPGDFGNYVVGYAVSSWEAVKKNDILNLIVQRVFELGYDAKKHGDFDKERGSGRRGGHTERIGKKYQWIAFYEYMARISDNFEMYDESSFRRELKVQYQGPWNPYVRDIDPTMLIYSCGAECTRKCYHWWDKTNYENWGISNTEWMENNSDFPDPLTLIQAADAQSEDWLVLDGEYEWSEPVRIGEEKWINPTKRVEYQISSFIIRKKDKEKFKKWGLEFNFFESYIPHPRTLYQVFSREYYWSTAYNFFSKPYYEGETWRKVVGDGDLSIGEVIVTAEWFLWEEEFDRSKESVIKYFKPCKTIFYGMNLKFSDQEGELIGITGDIICFDPSVKHNTEARLLIRRDKFCEFLKQNDLDCVWMVVGEKQVIGGNEEFSGRPSVAGFYFFEDNLMTGNMRIAVR